MLRIRSDECYELARESITFHCIALHWMWQFLVAFVSIMPSTYFFFSYGNFIDILLKLCLHIIELCRVDPIQTMKMKIDLRKRI